MDFDSPDSEHFTAAGLRALREPNVYKLCYTPTTSLSFKKNVREGKINNTNKPVFHYRQEKNYDQLYETRHLDNFVIPDTLPSCSIKRSSTPETLISDESLPTDAPDTWSDDESLHMDDEDQMDVDDLPMDDGDQQDDGLGWGDGPSWGMDVDGPSAIATTPPTQETTLRNNEAATPPPTQETPPPSTEAMQVDQSPVDDMRIVDRVSLEEALDTQATHTLSNRDTSPRSVRALTPPERSSETPETPETSSKTGKGVVDLSSTPTAMGRLLKTTYRAPPVATTQTLNDRLHDDSITLSFAEEYEIEISTKDLITRIRHVAKLFVLEPGHDCMIFGNRQEAMLRVLFGPEEAAAAPLVQYAYEFFDKYGKSNEKQSAATLISARLVALQHYSREVKIPINFAYLFLFFHQLCWEELCVNAPESMGLEGVKPQHISQAVNSDLNRIIGIATGEDPKPHQVSTCKRSVQFTFRLLVAILNKIYVRCKDLAHDDAVKLTCFASSSLFYELACHKGFSAYANIAKQKEEARDFCVSYLCDQLMHNFETYSSALKRLHPEPKHFRVYLSDNCGPTLISVFHLIAQSLCTENVPPSLIWISLKNKLTLEKIENVLGLPDTFLSSVPLPGKEKTKSLWERLKFF